MLNLKDSLNSLESSDEFKNFRKNNKRAYLCSFFRIVGESESSDWQIDFYLPEKDKMTSFSVSDKVKIIDADSKIFKKKEKTVDPLNLDKLKINLDNAFSIIEELKNKKYRNEEIGKKIIILQSIKIPMWNITYLTTSLNILNVKINAVSGKILEESFKPALSFQAK